ncbi:hydrogenase formation protein HypD [Thermovibrio sp.]
MEKKERVKALVEVVHKLAPKDGKVKIMNVCGSHEHTITYHGLRSLMPKTVELVPGPGCPVCVCSESDVINAINLSKRDDVILATYGDMLRVPTKIGSIRSSGRNYKMVSAPHEVLKIAKENPDKKVVFFSIGFETTTAPTAALLEMGVPENLLILTSQKLTPEIMEVLVKDSEVGVDAFIAPGHVSAIVGSNAWKVFPEEYGIPTVVAGFEPDNLLLAIVRILYQLKEGRAALENVYRGVVRPEGNRRAQELMYKYFYKTSVNWRGIGYIPNSGLELKSEYSHLDAKVVFNLPEIQEEKVPGCICDKIVLGKAYPTDCKLFKSVCTPRSPKGPCMVSQEGACNIWYRWGDGL